MRHNIGSRRWNDSFPPSTGLDSVSLMLGQLQTGQINIMDRLDDQDRTLEQISARLETGARLHADLGQRLTSLEERKPEPSPAWHAGLPKRELSILLLIAIAGLFGLLSPADIKDIIRTTLLGTLK